MREAMLQAPLGDDVYGEDPTVNELEAFTANLVDKEAALFVPSGVMGNQLCLKVLTSPGDEVLLCSEAHIFHYESAAPAVISQVQLQPLASDKGVISPATIVDSLRPANPHFPRTRVLCLENTHNRYGGLVLPFEAMRASVGAARDHGLACHCDGARLWNACAASNISPAAYCALFDTVSLCLSKGLGAPVGSMIAGPAALMDEARRWRKILGGGMRQAGILAAAGLYALREHRELLGTDHRNAALFAAALQTAGLCRPETEGQASNMVVFRLPEPLVFGQIETGCRERGLRLALIGPGRIRAVFHHQISKTQTEQAAAIVNDIVASLLKAA